MKARKKQIVVEVWKLDSEEMRKQKPDVPDWVASRIGVGLYFDFLNQRWYMDTLDGITTAHDRDYLVQGVTGEVYPVKDDVFKHTYEIIEP